MAQCPSCATEVAGDFGMATCPQCSLVFMIGIDGTTSAPEEAEVFASDESLYSANPSEDAQAEETDQESTYQESDYGSSSSFTEYPATGEDPAVVREFEEAISGEEASDSAVDAEPEQELEYNDNFLSGMDNDLSVEDPDATVVDVKDPLGVQRFDQGRASQLVDGPYYYDVTIDGLDTAEIKDEVMAALKDPRFQWTAEDIKKNFRQGKLVFKNLNPIKAVLMVIKLQHVDVDISWVQKMHTDPSVGSNTVG